VRLEGERVSVRADAAPLSQILESLAQRTGMKVVWERNLGRPNVTAIVEDCTPAEAVLRLLQGSGFNYAFSMDPSGTRIEMLMIVGVPSPEPPAQPGFVRARRAEPPPPAPGPEAAEAPGGDPTAVPEPADEDDAQSPQPDTRATPDPGAAPAPFPRPGPDALPPEATRPR
jgi:hypothetical protein